MLRITVEGWVTGRGASLLAEEGARRLQLAPHLVFDLEGVQFIDQSGIAVLKRWSRERLMLRGGSLFVRALLRQHGLG
jgi:anti-anti-sigma regulatory factor